MKKVFILLVSLLAMMAANLSVTAQETATAKASMGGDVIRSQHSFITNGNWNDGSHWDTGTVPPSGSDVVIMADAIIPAGYTAVVNEVSMEGGSITVADGGQLRHNTEGLVVTMKKNIEPYEDVNGTGNYYLLAFPFSVDVAVPNAMTAIEGNDFYKFDGDYLGAEWRNNKQETIATVSATTGYLYANSEAIELSLTGSTYPSYNEEVIPVTVPYDEGSTNPSNGWALLGNPFTCNAYIYYHNSDNELVPMEFMVYDATGELMTLSDEPIAPMQGFFVKVTETTTVYILNYADHSFHEYVDLGLPSGLLWATCNVGADNPEDYGDYFAWGETQPKDTYNWSTYQYCMGSENTLTKYCNNSNYGYNGFTDNLITLLPEDDAATANWGANWRMPTEEEWQELYQNTTHTWTTQNGVRGRLFTASNGNSLFLPAAGYRSNSNLNYNGSWGRYYSSSLVTNNPRNAWHFYFGSFECGLGKYDYRYYGRSVRAVRSAPLASYVINATAYPEEGGIVIGSGTYAEGAECTLTATPNEGYAFTHWTEDGEVVSTDATYSFMVTGDRNLVANFDHAYVDLGLPSGTLWATCNVGADSPEDNGDYFAWGETQPKDVYNWSTYQYCNGNYNTLTKYCNNSNYGYNGFTDNLTTLLPEDDAATANWGIDWRMPTQEEWQELYNNTTVTWTTQNGVNGRLFTASNGNSLFLPAAGYRYSSYLNDAGSYGNYWSSSLYTGSPYNAWVLYFGSGYYYMDGSNRVDGQGVRPVRSESQNNTPTGAINGKFTINEDGDQVYFSQGNLQYQASTNTWKFADNQYDYVGSDNSNISSTYSGWIDLFGWGTSGYNHGANAYQPWNTSQSPSDYYAYGSETYNLYDQTGQADWGYNAISNGGSATNQWRTLTGGSGGEWDYVFNTRITTSGIRYAKAQVNNVNGVILLPDDWSESYYSLSDTNNGGAGYGSNVISASNWTSSLQSHGAVFLPAAGYRCGTSVNGGNGCYWSASYKHSLSAYDAGFSDSGLGTAASEYVGRCDGQSVRLVCVAEN